MIKIDYIIDIKPDFDFNYELLSKKVFKEVLVIEKIPYNVSLCITLTNNNKIKKLNKKMRNINKITDVLSFPSLKFLKPSCFRPFIYKNMLDVSVLNPENNTIYLGDVVISIEKLKSQAKTFGHSDKREYSFLLCHSILHLLGYDHMNNKDEKKMFDKQTKVLDSLNIYR